MPEELPDDLGVARAVGVRERVEPRGDNSPDARELGNVDLRDVDGLSGQLLRGGIAGVAEWRSTVCWRVRV